jgi:hypothetical protein
MAELPVQAAAPNFVTAMQRFPASAAYKTFVDDAGAGGGRRRRARGPRRATPARVPVEPARAFVATPKMYRVPPLWPALRMSTPIP